MEKLDPEEESRKFECKVCMISQIEIIFNPCHHVVVCETCAVHLKKCPFCRVDITEMRKINFSNHIDVIF